MEIQCAGEEKEQHFQDHVQTTPHSFLKTTGMRIDKCICEIDPETTFPVPISGTFAPSQQNLQGKSRHSDYNQLPKPDLDLPQHQRSLESLMLPLYLPTLQIEVEW